MIRMVETLLYYSQTILFRTRSARTTSNVHVKKDPTADAKAVSSDHSYGHQCPTGFCNSLLTSLAQAIRDKEKEIQQLHCQLDKLRVKRPRMTLSHIQHDPEKVKFYRMFKLVTIINYTVVISLRTVLIIVFALCADVAIYVSVYLGFQHTATLVGTISATPIL